MKKKVYLISSVLIITIVSIFSPLLGNDDIFLKAGIQLIRNKKAPNFCLKDLNGKMVELKNFNGNVIFLTFWATWCTPCKKEMPTFEVLYQKFKHKKFSFFAISVDYENSNSVAEFIKRHGYTFPVLIDPKNNTIDLFEIKGIPATVIIDKKGMIVGKVLGQRDWSRPEVISLINFLLEKGNRNETINK